MARIVLKTEGLSFSYADGTKALTSVDLSVREGDTVGLIGPNGAGKSTLLLLIDGIFWGQGKIELFGLELNDKNIREIRSRVGLVFQDPDSQLFMPTVFDDCAFGPINMRLPKEKVEKAVVRALQEVDMLSSIKKTAHHLSYGEKKRISIATVLSMNPEIIVLDEPSSNLDPKHRRGLINLLESLKVTKIIATHDLDMVLKICNRVVVLDEGRIVADADVLEILSNKHLLEAHGLELPPSLKIHHDDGYNTDEPSFPKGSRR